MPKEKLKLNQRTILVKTGYQLGALEQCLNDIINSNETLFQNERLAFYIFTNQLRQIDQYFSNETFQKDLNLQPLAHLLKQMRQKDPDIFELILKFVKKYSEFAEIVDMALQESSITSNESENNSNQDNTNLKHSDKKNEISEQNTDNTNDKDIITNDSDNHISEESARPLWLSNINENHNDTDKEVSVQGSVLHHFLDDMS